MFRQIFKAKKCLVFFTFLLLFLSFLSLNVTPFLLSMMIHSLYLKEKATFFFYSLLWTFSIIFSRIANFLFVLSKNNLNSQLTLFLRSIVISKIKKEEKSNFFLKNTSQYLFWLTEEIDRIIIAFFYVLYSINYVLSFITKIVIIAHFHFYFVLITLFFFFFFLSYIIFLKDKLKKWSKEESLIGSTKNNFFRNFASTGDVMLLENKMDVFENMIIKLRKKFFSLYNIIALKREFITFIFVFLIMSVNSFIVVLSGIFTFKNLISLSAFFVMNYYVISALWDSNNIFSTIFKVIGEKHLVKKYSLSMLENLEDKLPHLTFNNLTLEKITFSYNEKKVINDFSLDIQRNNKILITGPSGSGKSTLSLIIAGVLKPTKGKLIFNQHILGAEEQMIYQFVNFISKNCSIFNATFEENLFFFNEKKKINSTTLKNILNLLEINNIQLHQQVSKENLSYGEMQRIMLARELIDQKEIFILDEALSNVEERLRDKIENFFLANKNLTFIHITHNFKNKDKYDKVVWLA